MSTKPMDAEDKSETIKAINGQYAAAGLKAPRIAFVPSPLVARFACGFASWILYCRNNPRLNTLDATYDATRDATDAATRAATYDATRDATLDATYDATRDATRDATLDATDAATDAATSDATYAATFDATDAATRDATYADSKPSLASWFVFAGSMPKLAKEMGVGLGGLKCAQHAWRQWRGNSQWSGWAACLSFFRHVAKLPIDYSRWDHYEKACIHAGPMAIHEEFCIVSDRPCVLKVDADSRPHCDDGPFCRWSDGFSLYAVHGVRVPAWIVERKDTITCDSIEAESNLEVRRVMIEFYGQARWLLDSGAVEIHRDDFGALYRKDVPGDESVVMVKVVNSTPEQDGSFKDYWLRVPPTMERSRQAVAWTFGKTELDYTPSLQT